MIYDFLIILKLPTSAPVTMQLSSNFTLATSAWIYFTPIEIAFLRKPNSNDHGSNHPSFSVPWIQRRLHLNEWFLQGLLLMMVHAPTSAYHFYLWCMIYSSCDNSVHDDFDDLWWCWCWLMMNGKLLKKKFKMIIRDHYYYYDYRLLSIMMIKDIDNNWW